MSYHNIIILANQVFGIFDQRYLKKEYTSTILISFAKQIEMEKNKQKICWC